MTTRIGRYEVLDTLGEGGMGVVYRAWDPELGREVAIKVVLSWAQHQPDVLARFIREAQVVARLRHPNVVTVFDAGRTEQGVPYFVMEYLQGTDLGRVIEEESTLPPSRAVGYALQVCAGLECAHSAQVVHRDIKPANLLLTPDDEVKIVDFGIAKLVGTQVTGSGVSLGTPLYMAPEQIDGGAIDRRTDIFALGGVLYKLISGSSPFEGASLAAVCVKIAGEDPPPLSAVGVEVSPEIEAVIMRALEKDPSARYQSADEMAEDLSLALRREEDLPSTLIVRRSLPRRRLAFAVVAGLALVSVLWAWPDDRLQPIEVPPPSEAEQQPEEPEPETNGQSNVEDAPGEPEDVPDNATRDEPVVIFGPLTPPSAIERQGVTEAVGDLVRALEAGDPAAVAALYGDEGEGGGGGGGAIPFGQGYILDRYLDGTRKKIRHFILDVQTAFDGKLVVEVRYDALFLGSPGTVPPPRTGIWVVVLEPLGLGDYRLLEIRPG